MRSRREHWWNASEAQAVAVYRARLALPALVITGALILPILVFEDMRRPGTGTFLLVLWIIFMLPLLIRRRRVAILTSDAFLYRPALGRILKVPLNGVKRASLVESSPNEDVHVPKIRIELLVGGEMIIPISVSDPEAVVRLVNKGAARGLAR
jgi:hypothetical protein